MRFFTLLFSVVLMQGSLLGQSQNMIYYANWEDPALPVRAGLDLSYNDIWGYEDGSNFYVMMGSLSYNHFFDVTDPENPVEVARIAGINMRNNTLNNSIWRDYKTYQSYAYSSADEGTEGLTVYDLSDLPDTVYKIRQDTMHFLKAHNIYIDVPNARLYVAGSGSNIIVYGLSNPAEPNHLATINLTPLSGFSNGYIHDVFVRDNIAYCSHGFNGYCAYNLANLNNPVKMACVELTGGYNHSSWLSDDDQYLVYAEELPKGKPMVLIHRDSFVNGLTEYWKPFKEPLLAPTHVDVTPHNPFFKDEYLYISYYEDGVVIFDMSNPYSPSRIAYYDTYPQNTNYNGTRGCWGVYPYFSNGLIAASDTKNGLFLLEMDIQPLAVDFTSFDVQCRPNQMRISWVSAQTRKDLIFTLQGSYDGLTFEDVTAFSPQESLSGSRVLNGFYPYSYYRLRSEDVLGKSTYSAIQSGCRSDDALRIFPNPASGSEISLHIQYPQTDQTIHITLFDPMGRKVFYRSDWSGGNLELPAGGWVPGVYSVRLDSDQGQVLAMRKWVLAE